MQARRRLEKVISMFVIQLHTWCRDSFEWVNSFKIIFTISACCIRKTRVLTLSNLPSSNVWFRPQVGDFSPDILQSEVIKKSASSPQEKYWLVVRNNSFMTFDWKRRPVFVSGFDPEKLTLSGSLRKYVPCQSRTEYVALEHTVGLGIWMQAEVRLSPFQNVNQEMPREIADSVFGKKANKPMLVRRRQFSLVPTRALSDIYSAKSAVCSEDTLRTIRLGWRIRKVASGSWARAVHNLTGLSGLLYALWM